MFERYTERARRAIFFARYEAAQFGCRFIEPHHLLLAILREDRELMNRFLGNAGRAAEEIRSQIEAQTPSGDRIHTSVDLPLSHATKRAIAYAAEEADLLGHRHIDTQHHLLGLLREGESLAANILTGRAVHLAKVRQELGRTMPADAEPRTVPGLPRMPGPDIRGLAAHGRWLRMLQDAARTLLLARQEAVERHGTCIETIDVLAALSIERDFSERFPEAAAAIQSRPKPTKASGETVAAVELPFTEDCQSAFTFAAQEAAKLGQRTGPVHLVLGILGVESCAAAEVLRECGLTTESVRAKLMPPPPPCDPEQGRSYV